MAELLKNPEKMRRTCDEIREVSGKSEAVQETDISKLPYLHAVVKETLRLHPPATITGRIPNFDIEFENYILPKDAEIFMNAWAISRDARVWKNPNSFEPERFLDCEIDVKGQHFELLPSGTGRRICLGLPLAHRMVHLMVASFLQEYDWKLEEGMRSENIDMSESLGLTMRKAVALKAIPVRCP